MGRLGSCATNDSTGISHGEEGGIVTLGELIQALERCDPDKIVRHGFGRPHSYRGYYEQLAFEPMGNRAVVEILADAKAALGATFMGYKGGEYRMDDWTDVWLANYGECGETIGPVLLDYMLKER